MVYFIKGRRLALYDSDLITITKSIPSTYKVFLITTGTYIEYPLTQSESNLSANTSGKPNYFEFAIGIPVGAIVLTIISIGIYWIKKRKVNENAHFIQTPAARNAVLSVFIAKPPVKKVFTSYHTEERATFNSSTTRKEIHYINPLVKNNNMYDNI